jgi:hypothetical protein
MPLELPAVRAVTGFIGKAAVETPRISELTERSVVVRKAIVTEMVKCGAIDFRYRSLAVVAAR